MNKCSKAEKGQERKKEGCKRKNDRKVINPNGGITYILEFNLFLETTNSRLDIIDSSLHLPAPMNSIIHIIRKTVHRFLFVLPLYFFINCPLKQKKHNVVPFSKGSLTCILLFQHHLIDTCDL